MIKNFLTSPFIVLALLFVSIPIRAVEVGPLPAFQLTGQNIYRSSDNLLLADVTAQQQVRLWSVRQRRQVATLDVGPAVPSSYIVNNKLNCVAFALGGRVVATSTGAESTVDGNREDISLYPEPVRSSGKIQLWDVQSGRLLRTMRHFAPKKANEFYFMDFSLDGKLLAALSIGLEGPTVQLWDVQTGKFLREFNYGSYGLSRLDFSADRTLLVGSGGFTLPRIWNVRTGKLRTVLQGKSSKNKSVSEIPSNIVFKVNRDFLYGDFLDYSIYRTYSWGVWNSKNGKLLRTIDLGPEAVLCADGKTIVNRRGNSLQFHDAWTGNLKSSVDISAHLSQAQKGDVRLTPSSDASYVLVDWLVDTNAFVVDVKSGTIFSTQIPDWPGTLAYWAQQTLVIVDDWQGNASPRYVKAWQFR
jgi:WD40 repeat protein